MTLRVFVGGQSNALGYGQGSHGWPRISGDVRVWNNVNPNGAVGDSFATAEQARAGGTFQYTNRDNFGVWFCDRLARDSLDSVDMTIVARGGSPISRWSQDEQQYPMLSHTIAVWAATGQPPADVMLWHQGEADASAPEGWGAAFDTVLSDLTAGGVINAQTVIVVGGIAENSKERISFNRRILFSGATRNRGGFASSHGVPTYDGVHFTSGGLRKLARRYYAAYLFAKLRSSQ